MCMVPLIILALTFAGEKLSLKDEIRMADAYVQTVRTEYGLVCYDKLKIMDGGVMFTQFQGNKIFSTWVNPNDIEAAVILAPTWNTAKLGNGEWVDMAKITMYCNPGKEITTYWQTMGKWDDGTPRKLEEGKTSMTEFTYTFLDIPSPPNKHKSMGNQFVDWIQDVFKKLRAKKKA